VTTNSITRRIVVNGTGTGPPPTPTAPGAPTMTTANAGSASVVLNWTAPVNNGGSAITSVLVRRGTTSGGETTLATLAASALTYTDSTAVNGTTYFYEIEYVNAVGTSSPSNELSATPTATPTVPTAPSLTSATPSQSQVALIWSLGSTGGSAFTAQQVWRGTTSGGETLLQSLGAGVLSFTDTAVTNGTTYFYVIKSVNAVGTSPASNEHFATPTAPASGIVIAQPSVTGGPPTARGQGFGGYDPVSEQIIYFGGNNGPAKSDTWAFNPATNVWTQITSATAPANVAVSIGHDPISNKMIMFGGDNESTFFNTTYSMDTTLPMSSWAWTLLNPTTKPAIRSGQSMFNDPVTGNLMMYGGNTGTPTYYDDLWTWNGSNWSQVSTALTGSGRTGAFVATMSNGTTVIFGGFENNVVNDTHVWNGTTCVAKSPATVPPARGFGGCAATSTGAALIYGGTNRLSNVNQSDCWLWNGTNWAQQTPTGVTIGGLSSQSMNAYPPTGEIVSAFGTAGPSVTTDINTVYTFTVGGSGPPPPPPTTTLQGLFTAAGTVSDAQSVASTLQMTLTGFSTYTTGTTYATIASYNPPTLPAGVTLMLAVNMLQNSGTFSQIATNIQTWKTLAAKLPNGTIVRLGWEFDIGTGTGGFGNVMTPANYVSGWQMIVTAMRSVNNALKYDWCCNAGTTTTVAGLLAWYPGDAYVDYCGFDHYDNPGGGGDFSNCGTMVNVANQRNKPVSCGEWGLTTTSPGNDDPTFINDAAQVFNTPSAAATRYGWPSYTMAYQSYFNDAAFHTDLRDFPNSEAAFRSAFP
jgi:hypothetical protein